MDHLEAEKIKAINDEAKEFVDKIAGLFKVCKIALIIEAPEISTIHASQDMTRTDFFGLLKIAEIRATQAETQNWLMRQASIKMQEELLQAIQESGGKAN